MATAQICTSRVQPLNDKASGDGDWILYWMQQSQRAEMNHALEFAVQRANDKKLRLLVAFALTADYPEANRRHYRFMLEGLQQVADALARRKIKFVIQIGAPATVITKLAKRASEVICDRGYLRHQVEWREKVAKQAGCKVWQVESDVIVPVESASDKREYAARTLRSQINDRAEDYLFELRTTAIDKDSQNISTGGESLDDLDALMNKLKVDSTVLPTSEFTGGTSQAKAHLRKFIETGLKNYGNKVELLDEQVSHLSPYLHFGQISPLAIALEVKSTHNSKVEGKDEFLEELLVRRELAMNFVHYERNYDGLACLPDWARETLEQHEDDSREHHYTASELENAETHDPAWNAAMTEMKRRGYLHNHLRMYWGKKIIEWTNTSGHAYRTALQLNNKYFLDGRDPNSFTNVLWLFGLHDRAHAERGIFGKVRYMSLAGLRRKCDIEEYMRHIEKQYDTEIKGLSGN